MLLAHRLCYDRDSAWGTGKYSRVKKIAHLMHIEVFEALRPFWWLMEEESQNFAAPTRAIPGLVPDGPRGRLCGVH